jgi:hypothetical protein
MQQNYEKKQINITKRRIASKKECEFDLKNELMLMFQAFYTAQTNYEQEVRQTPPQARARGFEASLLNSKMIQSVQQYFPEDWKFGKYKRFTLRINGYIILFKKFNKNGLPMNIKTKSVNAITNQQTLSLFDDSTMVYEPILFFGYEKNKIGEINNPRLIYLDEEQVKWVITNEMIELITQNINNHTIEEERKLPKLRQKAIKKASGK